MCVCGGGGVLTSSYIIYPKCANTESKQWAKNGKNGVMSIFTCHIQDPLWKQKYPNKLF